MSTNVHHSNQDSKNRGIRYNNRFPPFDRKFEQRGCQQPSAVPAKINPTSSQPTTHSLTFFNKSLALLQQATGHDASNQRLTMAPNDESDMEMEALGSQCNFLTQVTATVIDIDQRGDRIVQVGTNKCEINDDGNHLHTEAMRFRVCSKALARSTPVMEAMLFGNFREAAQETIHLPEDNPKGMELLLHLAHGNIEIIYEFRDRHVDDYGCTCPDDEFVDDLYAFVVAADKYLMMHKLRPFITIWCDALIEWDEEAIQTEDHNAFYQRLKKSLWLAYKFGHLQLYRVIFVHLAWFLEPDHYLFQHVPEPDGAADQIRLGRTRRINEALIPTRDAVRALIDDVDPTGVYLCNKAVRQRRLRCQAHTLRTMIRNLNENELWPLPQPEDIKTAAWWFVIDLENSLWKSYTPQHRDCTTPHMLAARLSKLSTFKQDEYSIPSKPVLQTMVSTAKSLKAFDYQKMYDKTEVADML
ncbi:hypothetical protein G7054_g8118 [Neopestalotiopsis clavispora]|nr:hypothetical protein G7054_g8118 [Neopestalotiopsis clavispora]